MFNRNWYYIFLVAVVGRGQRRGPLGERPLKETALRTRGRATIRRHALAPLQLDSMAGRTLRDAELLSAVLLAIYYGTPQLAGLYVGREPAINPERAVGRAEALVTIHQWANPEDAIPIGTIPWLPAIVREEEYRRTTLIIEIDDGIPPEGLRRRHAT